ncbi:hypothetical protein J2129_000042 [Methanofollis sp. W23]|nr:hypothetical protein [Methanofollis sp. W23]
MKMILAILFPGLYEHYMQSTETPSAGPAFSLPTPVAILAVARAWREAW